MGLSPVLDAAKNWTSTFSRFGFGVLVMWMLNKLGFSFLETLDADINGNAATSVFFAVAWAMIAVLIGSSVLYLGGLTLGLQHGSRFNEVASINRAFKVGQTGNQMLFEALRDANNKYDLACGFYGVTVCGAMFIFISIFFLYVPNASYAVEATEHSLFKLLGAFGIGTVSGHLISGVATRSYEAIDTLLLSLHPINEQNE